MKPGDFVEVGVRGTFIDELVWNKVYIINEERRRLAINARNAAEHLVYRNKSIRNCLILLFIGAVFVSIGTLWLFKAKRKPKEMLK
jgi:hypothetical protein